MDQSPQPDNDSSRALQNLWRIYSEIFSKRGIDLFQALHQWTVREVEQLASPGARSDFQELCDEGCEPEILAIMATFIRWSPQFEQFWKKIYGNPDERRRVQLALEKSAKALESLFAFSISLEDEAFTSEFSEIGRITPSRLVTELRLYASTLDLINRIPREAQTRSLADFGKFVLAEYVKQTTGRFRDRNVSALIAETVGPEDYNEVAHRMWRSRNFRRMRSHFSKLSELISVIRMLTANHNVTDSGKQ